MRVAVVTAVLAAIAGITPATASAADPGRWIVTSAPRIPNDWRQGLAADTSGDVFFTGPFVGVHLTRDLVQKAANDSAIPPDVQQREQYNHIGDLAWDPAEGGRLLLPLESYKPFDKDTNPSKTGSIGVMDAKTLKWKYYVKLDPAEIAKAQWIATGAGGLFWTITGSDLLAYRLGDLTLANQAPAGAPIHSVRRLPGVIPGGAGGAAEIGGRLYMSTSDAGVDRIVSVDLATGASQIEYEQPGNLESEGVDVGAYLGGILHVAFVSGLGGGQLLNLLPTGAPLRLRLVHAHVRAGKPATVSASAVVATSGFRVPLAGVQVRIGRARAKTNAAGKATLKVKLTRGSYSAHAFYKGLKTATAKLRAV